MCSLWRGDFVFFFGEINFWNLIKTGVHRTLTTQRRCADMKSIALKLQADFNSVWLWLGFVKFVTFVLCVHMHTKRARTQPEPQSTHFTFVRRRVFNTMACIRSHVVHRPNSQLNSRLNFAVAHNYRGVVVVSSRTPYTRTLRSSSTMAIAYTLHIHTRARAPSIYI